MTKRTKKSTMYVFIIIISLGISFSSISILNTSLTNHHVYDEILSTSSTGWNAEITKAIGIINEFGFDVFVGDANNDGYNDIATANHYTDDISLLLWNPGSGDWDSYIKKSVGDLTRSVTIGDTNNDGKNDLVVGWWAGSQERIAIFLWNSSKNDWDSPISKNIACQPGNLHVGDVNNDGDNDILVGGYGGDHFSCFFWNASISDWNHKTSEIFSAPCEDVFLGDADNDGLIDVVATLGAISSPWIGKVAICLWNDSINDWNPAIEKSVGHNPRNLYIGDANNDGFNDIAVVNPDDDDISIFLWNNSIMDWNGELKKTVGDEPYSLSINDANNDGYQDLVVANQNDDSITIYVWNHTSNDWFLETPLTISFGPIEVFVEDANNDGLNDIVSSGFPNYISILLAYIDSPILDVISPSLDVDGFVDLNWNDVKGTTHYYVYRDTSYISSIDDMNPIATVTDSNYTDFVNMNGDHYYVVVAGDVNGNSSISNCENVTVSVPLIAPILSQITPDPDLDGSIDLDWDDVDRATSYSIYRETSFISSVDSLTPIDTSTESNYTDSLVANDIYYYAITAVGGSIISPISNCENVTVMMTLTEPTLSPISPTTDHDGTIYLEWDVNIRSTFYYIYRDVSFISTINSLIPIDTTSDNYYYDTVLQNGTFYFVVVAGDGFVNSSISNCENVTVDLSLNSPTLDTIMPNPNYSGEIILNWDDIEGATIYYVFRDQSLITSINSAELISITSNSNFTDIININGLYYYVVIAGNGVVNSTISLNRDVMVLHPLDTPDLFYVNEYGGNEVLIQWEDLGNEPTTTFYYLYRDTNFITTVDHLDPITVIADLSYIDALTQSGEYFYVVVASDGFVNSSISNCISIYFVYTSQTPGIPGYNITFILLIGTIAIFMIMRQTKRKQK